MRLKTSTQIFLSAAGWTGTAILLGEEAIGTIFLVSHVIYWRTHVLEVKLNKLLDERGIFVANYELNE